MSLGGLLRLDVHIFYLINSVEWPGWASTLLSLLARSSLWMAPLALFFLSLVIVGKSRARLYVVSALLTLFLTELFVSAVLKPVIARPRPCSTLPDVRLVGGCTKSFSMPSGHGANAFGQALLLGLTYPPTLPLALPVAGLVALSRVSDGKHYPSDVALGGIVGVLVALGVRRGLLFLWRRRFLSRPGPHRLPLG